jgi:hypothetical protein
MSTKNAPISVGIVGLGRSGWNIHARTIKTIPDRSYNSEKLEWRTGSWRPAGKSDGVAVMEKARQVSGMYPSSSDTKA